MLFDTHAHYDDGRFDADRDTLLRSLPSAGVALALVPGCDGESSRAAVALAARYPHVYAAVGWHPSDLDSWDGDSLALLRTLAQNEKVVAIGEIGLDYYWDKTQKARQAAALRQQLELALALSLPVIVHDRDAHEDALAAVCEYPALRGVFHCFSGSAEMARELLRRGWYLGFDGPVTYKSNKKAAEVLAVTPAERILIETDSPYLTPEPFRGRRNDSTRAVYIAQRVAELKGLEPKELERIALENGKRLFGIE